MSIIMERIGLTALLDGQPVSVWLVRKTPMVSAALALVADVVPVPPPYMTAASVRDNLAREMTGFRAKMAVTRTKTQAAIDGTLTTLYVGHTACGIEVGAWIAAIGQSEIILAALENPDFKQMPAGTDTPEPVNTERLALIDAALAAR
jgi:hypothetical protein